MVAQDSGYSARPPSPAKERANFAGVNLPAPKRGECPYAVDHSFEANPERMADVASHMDLIRTCTLQHPKECKYLRYVVLHYVDGWSMKEIAEEMKVSPSTVKERFSSTLNFLETYIREHEHKA